MFIVQDQSENEEPAGLSLDRKISFKDVSTKLLEVLCVTLPFRFPFYMLLQVLFRSFSETPQIFRLIVKSVAGCLIRPFQASASTKSRRLRSKFFHYCVFYLAIKFDNLFRINKFILFSRKIGDSSTLPSASTVPEALSKTPGATVRLVPSVAEKLHTQLLLVFNGICSIVGMCGNRPADQLQVANS